MALPRSLTNIYKVLAIISFLDGSKVYIQNWQIEPLAWRGKSYNYYDFPTPPLSKKIGEDAQSLVLLLPNVSCANHGYLPIRDWVESGKIAGAYFSCFVFNASKQIAEHVFVVQEQEFDESQNQSQIRLTLRQPDSRTVIVNNRVFSSTEIGESARVAR